MRTVSRQQVFGSLAGLVALSCLPTVSHAASSSIGRLRLSDAEWRKRLSPEQFAVLRRAGTEEPFTSPLLNEHRQGAFACVACALDLFDSATKFDSHTGWPSFFRARRGAVSERRDTSLPGEPRTEVRCARCDGHLGHVFTDGPAPTGLRYCMNGVALTFHPR